jgi:hypothetical protein
MSRKIELNIHGCVIGFGDTDIVAYKQMDGLSIKWFSSPSDTEENNIQRCILFFCL